MPKAGEYPSHIYRKDMMKAFEELGIPTEGVRGIVFSHSGVTVIRNRRDNNGDYVVIDDVLLTERTTIGIKDEADRP